MFNVSAFFNSAGKSFRRIAPTDCTKVSKRSFMHRHFSLKLRFHAEPSLFSCWTVEIFMLNGPDFHDDRSRFSRWTVEIFILSGWDIHVERSRFSCWLAQIFIMNGGDFHDEWLRFSWWTILIFRMNSPDLHNDSRWQVKSFVMTGGELLYCFGFNHGTRREHLAIKLLAFINLSALSN